MLRDRVMCGMAVFLVAVLASGAPLAADLPERIFFHGVLDPATRQADVSFVRGTGTVSVSARRITGGYALAANIRHLAVFGRDVTADVSGSLRRGNENRLNGDFLAQYILLDHKPVRDALGSFRLANDRLVIERLGLGAFTGKGWISLSDGHEMDLSLRLAPEDMGLLWDMAGRYRLPLEGILEAEVDLKGPWSGPRISGRVSARDGSIRRFAFSEIDLRFEGTGARIHFEDARVVPAEGPLFRVSGALDLADVAGLPQQLQHLRKDLVVVDDGTNRTWAFRGADDAGDGHATQLRSFVSGQDSRDEMAGVLGVQKQIGF